MNGPQILEHFRDQLAEEVFNWAGDLPSCAPLNISPWLAMSLMQKAIRRGRAELALKAAATLLKASPERLWRRIGVTAYEDIGVADFEAVALVTVALMGKTWRAKVGGEWAVASYLVHRLSSAVKCRATDDLFHVCELHSAFEHARLELTFKPISELLDRIVGQGALPERALALWFAVGTDRCRSEVLRKRRGDPGSVLDWLCERGIPETLVEVCREGLRKSNGILAVFLVLLLTDARDSVGYSEPDNFPK